MIRAVLLALTLLAASVALAQDAGGEQRTHDPLAEANALYRGGQFAEAASRYQDVLAAGFDGPRVHYNLGNALYRSGARGGAIAHYQAAQTMAPRDDDIRTNLDRALAERSAGRPAPPASWLHAVSSGLVGTFTLSEFAVAAAVCWWGALAALTTLLIGASRRRTVRRVAVVLGMLAIGLAALAGGRWWAWHQVDRAVVSVESAAVRTGPGESFEAALSVQEGWTLRVLRQDGGWAEVVEEGGATGWLPVTAMVTVPPRAGGHAPRDG